MAKSKLRFTENEIRRAIRAATKAGLQIGRVMVDPASGNIVVVAAGDDAPPTIPRKKKVEQRSPKGEAVP
jgi:hypothetical protein